MATVDSLDIEISASAKKANKAIDDLCSKLNTLSSSIEKINGSNLSGLSNGVEKLGRAVKTLNGVKTTDYTRIAKGLEKFSKIDASGFGKTASGLNILARGIYSLSSVENIGNITPAINALKNLAKVDMSGFDTTKMQSIANTMSSFVAQLSGVGKIEGSVTRLVSAMARLSDSGQYIGNVVTYFPQFGEQVVSLVRKLSTAGTIDTSIARVVDGISRLANAGKKVHDTTNNLKSLGDAVLSLLSRLKHAPAVNANIANTIQGLGNLAASGSRISSITGTAGNSVRSFASCFRSTTSAIRAFSSSLGNVAATAIPFGKTIQNTAKQMKSLRNSSSGLAGTIGLLYAKLWTLKRAGSVLFSSISSAQDYVEDFNYFSVALGKIGADAAENFKEYGYNSAQEYADSFKSKFTTLQKQMTGYIVDTDTGNLDFSMSHNLGLDISEVMSYQGAIAQITNSSGMLAETSIMTSKAMSMLAADWSSLANEDLSTTMEHIRSGLIGQSRAVYSYGIDITQASLAQVALNHGVKESVKNLSNQSKEQLRAIAMLEQSKVAYGDLARTINQPANQLRMLQAGFKNLSRAIGAFFVPILEKVYPYLNAVVMVLQEFAQWVAKITGIKIGGSDGISFPDYSDVADDMDDYADSADNAAKKQKKFNDNLQGFDIVNKLQDNSSDSDSDSGNKNADIDLSSDLAKALADYEKVWNQAFKSNQNKAVQLANKIKNALLDGWRKGGDFTDVGKALAQWINKGLANIPWSKIKTTIKKIVRSIATFLNGFIEDLDWALVGENIAEGLNTAIEASYTWWTTFNWLQFGTSLATMLNSALNKLDAKKLGKTLGAKLRGMIQFAFGFITTFNFNQLGTKIADSINGFFEEMGEVRQNTGLTGWQELGKSISDGIKGILDTINTALSTVKWTEIGKAIGDFLGSIDWLGILAKTGKMIVLALWNAIKTAFSAFASDPIGVGSTLVTVLGVIFGKKALFDKLLPTLKTGFGNLITNSLTGAQINTTKVQGTFSTLGTKLGKIVGVALAAKMVVEIAAGIANANLEKNIGSLFNNSGEGSLTTDISITLDWMNRVSSGEFISLSDVEDEWAQKNAEAKKSKTDAKKEKQNKKAANEMGLSQSDYTKYQEALAKFQREAVENGIDPNVAKNYINAYTTQVKKGAITVGSLSKKFNKAITENMTGKSVATQLNLLKYHMDQLGVSEKQQTTIAEKLSKAYKDGKISYADYASLAKRSFSNTNELKTALSNLGIKMPKATSETKSFKEGLKNLSSTFDRLGTKPEKQSEYIEILEDAVDNGTLSMKDYRKIVDDTTISSDELSAAIKKVKPKSVKVSANVNGKKTLDEIDKEIKSMKDKTVKVDAQTKGEGKITSLSDAWNAITEKTKTLTATFNDNFTVPLKKAWNNVAKSINKFVAKIPFVGEKIVKVPTFPGYATGGFPSMGQLFIANEAGPELVGNMNGKTTVANQNEIAEGFASAITKTLAPVMYAAFKQAATETAQQNGGDVYLDGRKITESVVSHVNNISKSRGKSPIWGVT